jgi:histone H3/H4
MNDEMDNKDENYTDLDDEQTKEITESEESLPEQPETKPEEDPTDELVSDEESEEDITDELVSDEESEEVLDDEESEGLPFAKAEVVRLMKQNLDKDKMIRERVKVEMNKFLGEVLERVCEQLNEYPYTTIEYEMLKESIYPYKNIRRINEEKKRILMHLEAIKADCDALSMDVRKSLKLKDVHEEDDFNRF